MNLKDEDTNTRFFQADEETAPIVAGILGEAFSTDPISNWISQNPAYHRYIFELLMPFYLQYGEVWLSADKDAAIMCLGPDVTQKFQPSLRAILRFVLKFGPFSLSRISRLARQFEKSHYRDRHYYLLAIGTSDRARGKGRGGEILKMLIERAEATGVPIYAENSNPDSNRGFYSAHGFKIGEPVSLGRNAPSYEPILRPSSP